MQEMAKDISDIPLEVLDIILDFLHNDAASLRAASLVSRGWVHESRHHLFNKITLKDVSSPPLGINLKNARPFLELARSNYCTFLAAIRSATFFITNAELIMDIVAVLASSKLVNQLIVRNFTQEPTSWDVSAFPNVRDLTYNAAPEFGENPWALVGSFSELHTLALYTHCTTVITLPSDVSGFHFNSLRTLRLNLMASDELFHWMGNLDGAHYSLETLDLQLIRACHTGWGPVTALNSFLRGTAATLQHLIVRVEYDNSLKEDLSGKGESIDLSPLVNLCSLWFRTHDINAVCNSLATLSSPHMTGVVIHALYWPWDCTCDLTDHLPRLADIMNEDLFNRIDKLDVSVPWGSNLDVAKEKFTKWKDARRLTISRTTYDFDQPNGFYSFWDLMAAPHKS